MSLSSIWQVTCESSDQGSSPVKGRVSYDSRQMKAEFTPLRTLFPNSKIVVQLHGKALTTSHCSQSTNIKDALFSFHTCNPPPKTVGIRLKDQSNVTSVTSRIRVSECTEWERKSWNEGWARMHHYSCWFLIPKWLILHVFLFPSGRAASDCQLLRFI